MKLAQDLIQLINSVEMIGARAGHQTMQDGAQCPLDAKETTHMAINSKANTMNYKLRYAPESTGGPGKRGRNPNPESWASGPCPLAHDKHYGYLKHKAQARYRGEDYSLTLEDWMTMWTDELWLQRGRTSDSYCLQQIDAEQGWSVDNVEIVPRRKHFSDIKKRNRDAQ